MKRPAILKAIASWHGEDREVFVTDEKGEMYFVQLDRGMSYWVFKDRIEFTDQDEENTK